MERIVYSAMLNQAIEKRFHGQAKVLDVMQEKLTYENNNDTYEVYHYLSKTGVVIIEWKTAKKIRIK